MNKLSLLCCCCCLAAVAAAAAESNSFYDYFIGEWTIAVYSGTPLEVSDEVRYSIHARNGSTTVLDGFYEREEGRTLITIEFSNGQQGTWHESPDDEEAVPTRLFEFSMTNLTNGYWVSLGAYGTDATYQLIVSGPSMVMTVTKDAEVKVWSFKKFVDTTQRSFFQKYGMLLILGGFMIFNMMKSRTQAPAAAPAPAASRPARQGAAASGAAAKSESAAAKSEASGSKAEKVD
eukprot:TRINITY_DN9273_c0_g1_i1.p1 TRINITY_DN9273_c0_g1~~TRINITY_DN9273_c0_g1_i1.p1  ORF type:complete len:256 (+),score=70.28 TRINITY_DN9273_c0_g1_i1:71-769(+)